MKKVIDIQNKEGLVQVVDLIRSLSKPSKNIILLNGELGSGKTTLVSEFCKYYNIESSSPTFSLIQEYQSEKTKIAHIDLYRLNNDSEIDASGFWDLFSQDYHFVFIEWSSKLNKNDLPLDWLILNLDLRKTGENQREVTIAER